MMTKVTLKKMKLKVPMGTALQEMGMILQEILLTLLPKDISVKKDVMLRNRHILNTRFQTHPECSKKTIMFLPL